MNEQRKREGLHLDWKAISYVAAGLLAFVLLVIVFKPAQRPEQVVESYVSHLSEGKCRRAYRLVSSYTKDYYDEYRTLDDFKQNVCDKVYNKYDFMEIVEIVDVIGDGDKVTVYFRFRYKVSWMTRKADRDVKFELYRKGRKWYVEGPFLSL